MKNISIITINYNNLLGIVKTTESIKNQKNQNFEWIIIDGGSTDGSVEAINNSQRADKYSSEKDKGIYDAMWKGLNAATSEYILFLNSGDIFYDEYSIEKIQQEILTKKYDVYFFSTKIIGLNKNFIRYPRKIESSKYSVPAVQQSTIYKKKSLQNIEWPFDYKICGDFSITLQLYINGASHKINDAVISTFELGGVSTQKPLDLAKEAFQIQRRFYKKSKIMPYIYIIKRILIGYIILLFYKIKI